MEAPRKARAERVRSEKEKNLANCVVKKLSITSLPADVYSRGFADRVPTIPSFIKSCPPNFSPALVPIPEVQIQSYGVTHRINLGRGDPRNGPPPVPPSPVGHPAFEAAPF